MICSGPNQSMDQVDCGSIRRRAVLPAVLVTLLLACRRKYWPSRFLLYDIAPDLASTNPDLAQRRASWCESVPACTAGITDLNARCASVLAGSAADAACQKAAGGVVDRLSSHTSKRAATSTPMLSPRRGPTSSSRNLEALGLKLGWSLEKQTRVNAALHKLEFRWRSQCNRRLRSAARGKRSLAAARMRSCCVEASKVRRPGVAGAGAQRSMKIAPSLRSPTRPAGRMVSLPRAQPD